MSVTPGLLRVFINQTNVFQSYKIDAHLDFKNDAMTVSLKFKSIASQWVELKPKIIPFIYSKWCYAVSSACRFVNRQKDLNCSTEPNLVIKVDIAF